MPHLEEAIAASAAMSELAAQAQTSVVLIKSGDRGIGSGVVWRDHGLLLTNHHVVAGHAAVEVVFDNDRELTATVLASDPVLDLGVIKVDAVGLPAARIRTEPALRVGELVIAIGNPLGHRRVVTCGIVSGIGAVNVPWRSEPATYLRSDVQLAPGNSGGPLLDLAGRIVGINAMIFGGDLSVAIPSSIVSQYLSTIEQRPLLGVGVQPVPLPHPIAERVGQHGALKVVALVPGGSAARAGCQIGDVLLALDDVPLVDAPALRSALDHQTHGRQVALRHIRDGAPQTLIVELTAIGATTPRP